MPRPTKRRKVCHFPRTLEFRPVDGDTPGEAVVLTVDEYETVRLIDREGLSQEQCACSMEIARTTVQRIYESARTKLAESLVEGRPLRIAGGDFRLCRGQQTGCAQEECYKHRYYTQYRKSKGEHEMRVAVTYRDGEIFQHFGHTEQFKLYDVENGTVTDSRVVDTNGSGHGALAGILTALGADTLICGGIGGGAQAALAAANIRIFGGVSGSADAAVEALLAESLAYDPNAKCTHHDGDHHHHHHHHHHHGEGHTCGNHGCGSGHCGDHE